MSEPINNVDRPWGYMIGDVFIPLPKQPMLLAGFTKPPFVVTLPDGRERHIIEDPIQCSGQDS
jgi:hypothetical protein